MKRVAGVVVGLVTDVDARLARVKLRFPWLEMAEDSIWAPIASLLAGKRRGARFMPEIDDEALVAFAHGDFEHPYVIGFLWNGLDEAPDDVATNRVVVTPGGHELRFEDKDGDRRIVLKTANEHMLEMDDAAGRIKVATKNGGTVTLLDNPGTATIEASSNRITVGPSGIEITAARLTISASAMTTIKASGPLTIESSAAVSVTATAIHVDAALVSFSGVVQANTVMAAAVVTTSVVSSTYTPGAGNLI